MNCYKCKEDYKEPNGLTLINNKDICVDCFCSLTVREFKGIRL